MRERATTSRQRPLYFDFEIQLNQKVEAARLCKFLKRLAISNGAIRTVMLDFI